VTVLFQPSGVICVLVQVLGRHVVMLPVAMRRRREK
jgi:hypothetical protein